MSFLKNKFTILFFFLFTGCSSIPSNTANSCLIFDERYLWFKHTKKVEQKWGTPIYIQLAIIKMESDFDWLAKPPRKKIFKIIPLSDTIYGTTKHKKSIPNFLWVANTQELLCG